MNDQTTPTVGVPVVLAIPHQRIADLVTTAIEGGACNIWLEAVKPASGTNLKMLARKYSADPWYSVGQVYAAPNFQMVVTVDKPTEDHPGHKTLTLADFQMAFVLMATKDDGAYARHFGDFLNENEDALTGDLFMQFAVYGEEVYS